jgi:hypothetical protein
MMDAAVFLAFTRQDTLPGLGKPSKKAFYG